MTRFLQPWLFLTEMLGGKMTDTWCQLSFEGIQPSVNIKVGHITIMMTFALHQGPMQLSLDIGCVQKAISCLLIIVSISKTVH